jgi:predicted phosphoribosyltransferase
VRFRDRREAGRLLAAALEGYADRPDALVLGLPRGGVVVAAEVARGIRVPLDVWVVRKLGLPENPELAIGAIGRGGVRVLNDDVIRELGIGADVIESVAADEAVELERRERLYRGARPFPELAGKTAILVDDGLATGSTMRAAVLSARAMAPSRVVVAVPVGAAATCVDLGGVADEVVCLRTPDPFRAVGVWYEDFAQTTDDEVRALLNPSSAPP